MCKAQLRVYHKGSWRKTCPTHPQEKLRKGAGCHICGFGNWKGQVVRCNGQKWVVGEERLPTPV